LPIGKTDEILPFCRNSNANRNVSSFSGRDVGPIILLLAMLFFTIYDLFAICQRYEKLVFPALSEQIDCLYRWFQTVLADEFFVPAWLQNARLWTYRVSGKQMQNESQGKCFDKNTFIIYYCILYHFIVCCRKERPHWLKKTPIKHRILGKKL
jgi:hypothetical protein